jgi:hypothetical protein
MEFDNKIALGYICVTCFLAALLIVVCTDKLIFHYYYALYFVFVLQLIHFRFLVLVVLGSNFIVICYISCLAS